MAYNFPTNHIARFVEEWFSCGLNCRPHLLQCAGEPQCLLAPVVFVIPKLFATVAASAGRPVLDIVVFFQRTARRKTPIAQVAAEMTIG
jgi:hypothetical protein